MAKIFDVPRVPMTNDLVIVILEGKSSYSSFSLQMIFMDNGLIGWSKRKIILVDNCWISIRKLKKKVATQTCDDMTGNRLLEFLVCLWEEWRLAKYGHQSV